MLPGETPSIFTKTSAVARWPFPVRMAVRDPETAGVACWLWSPNSIGVDSRVILLDDHSAN